MVSEAVEKEDEVCIGGGRTTVVVMVRFSGRD